MTALRRLGRWLWSLKDWRIVQADDPIGLMYRHPADDPEGDDRDRRPASS